jgi:TolA-binding protein
VPGLHGAPVFAAQPDYGYYEEIRSLRQESAQLRDLVERMQHRIDLLEAQQTRFNLEMDDRLAELEDGAVSAAGPEQAGSGMVPESTPAGASAGVVQTEQSVSGKESDRFGDRAVYKSALRDYYRGALDDSEKAFAFFLESYPDSSLRPNALFWLGVIYQSTDRLDEALSSFDAVIQLAPPDNNKLPEARFRKGLVLEARGEPAAARETWMQLAQQFPEADVTRAALERIY